MNIDLTSEQLRIVYKIFSDNLEQQRRKIDSEDWSWSNAKSLNWAPDICITDVLNERLELNEKVRIKKILERRLEI